MKLIALIPFNYDGRILEVGEPFETVNKPALGRLLIAIGRARAAEDTPPAKPATKRKRK